MIDKQLKTLATKSSMGGITKFPKGSAAHSFVEEALTAIYEIGLECIGADEDFNKLAYLNGNTQASVISGRNDLRASQRKAWAKVCGVDITNKEKL